MPTKRRRTPRNPGRTVTPYAVALYREAKPLRDGYIRSIRSQCPDCTEVKHCPACLKYLDLARALDCELGIKPGQDSPLDVDGPCPWVPGTVGAKLWPKTVELKNALEAACEG